MSVWGEVRCSSADQKVKSDAECGEASTASANDQLLLQPQEEITVSSSAESCVAKHEVSCGNKVSTKRKGSIMVGALRIIKIHIFAASRQQQ